MPAAEKRGSGPSAAIIEAGRQHLAAQSEAIPTDPSRLDVVYKVPQTMCACCLPVRLACCVPSGGGDGNSGRKPPCVREARPPPRGLDASDPARQSRTRAPQGELTFNCTLVGKSGRQRRPTSAATIAQPYRGCPCASPLVLSSAFLCAKPRRLLPTWLSSTGLNASGLIPPCCDRLGFWTISP